MKINSRSLYFHMKHLLSFPTSQFMAFPRVVKIDSQKVSSKLFPSTLLYLIQWCDEASLTSPTLKRFFNIWDPHEPVIKHGH